MSPRVASAATASPMPPRPPPPETDLLPLTADGSAPMGLVDTHLCLAQPFTFAVVWSQVKQEVKDHDYSGFDPAFLEDSKVCNRK